MAALRILLLSVLILVTARPAQADDATPVAEWTGSGDRTTETFTVTTPQWRIRWTGEGPRGVLGIRVHPAAGGRAASVGTQMDVIGGESVQRGAGDYYLEVIAANITWTIAIDELP